MSTRFLGSVRWLFLLGASFLLVSCGGTSRPSGVLLAVSQGATLVESYGLNLNNGTITQINTGTATGNAPIAIVLDPTGGFAYVANSADNTISTYTVNSDGTVTAGSSSTATGSGPAALTMDKAGKFLFAVNKNSNDVSVYSVSGASLTEVAGSPFPTGVVPTPTVTATAAPNSVTVTPSGNYVYVANQGQDSVSAFSLDPSSGVLTPLVGLPVTVGTAPSAVLATATPNSVNVLYVANQGSNTVSTYLVNTDGTLTLSGASIASGLAPVALGVDSTLNFLYVVNQGSNGLTGYRVNPGNGQLTSISAATVSTGSLPTAIALRVNSNATTPSDFVYVANSGSDSISGFSVTAQSGALTALGNSGQHVPAGGGCCQVGWFSNSPG